METSANSELGRLGKVFEQKLAQAFRGLEQQHPVAFKRLIDSREAGNLVRAQESDFEFIVRSDRFGAPFHFMLEAKSSVKYDNFSTCFRQMVKADQRALMMKRERAGCKGLYFFYSEKTRMVELWDGNVINDAWPQKRQPLNQHPRLVIELAQLPNFALYMVKNPEEFTKPRIS